MNHKEKVKLARKNLTSFELVHKVSIFSSAFWKNRRQEIKKRVEQDILKSRVKNG